MSNSARLRQTHKKIGGGKAIFNESAKSLENNLYSQVEKLISIFQTQYPDIEFRLSKKITKNEIAKKARRRSYTPCNPKSHIRPDGGILEARINRKWYPILVSEAKKQGTNTDRVKEGLKPQASGNAVERAAKNYLELMIYFEHFSYFPYIIFVSGCDFAEGSSINDRLDSMTKYYPRNVDYTLHPKKLATIYVKEEAFAPDDIFDKIYSMSVKVIRRILREQR